MAAAPFSKCGSIGGTGGIDAAQNPFAGDDMTLPGRPE
jgi:hypothetical protein